MANRVQVVTNKPNKKKDRFFTRPQSNFKSNRKHQFTKSKLQKNTLYFADKKNIEINKASVSGSDGFFIKPNHKPENKVFQTKSNQNSVASKSDKKPFDKKKYRLQKYSNKYKLQQWEENRKKAVLRNYYRNIKDDESKLDVTKIYEEAESESEIIDNSDDKTIEENQNNLNTSVDNTPFLEVPGMEGKEITPRNSKGKKNKAFKKAHLEFQRIVEEKKKNKEEILKKKAERAEALQEYKKKKIEKFKILSRKTKKGQPIMKDRIELLLKKIQDSMQ